ncbi:MAG: hypothetical protein LUG98_10095 [Tannerellaceae bacterium]|nr:hypothetical protein [Tannerellaceae bacterium]
MRKNLFFLLPFFVIIGMTGCDKKEEDPIIYDLEFHNKEFHGELGRTFSISIYGGNKDYTITPTHPDMLTYKLDIETGLGVIEITPLKKGSTTIQVKDNVTSQEETLKINITDKYIYLYMSYVDPEKKPQIEVNSDDPGVKERIIEKMKEELTDEAYTLALINNERKTFYRLDSKSESEYKESGYYSLEKDEEERYFLILTTPIDCGVDKKEIYEFDTSRDFPGYILLTNYFEIDWTTRANLNPPPAMYLKRDITEELKEEFPELESARWLMEAQVSIAGKMPLEWFD